MADKYLINRETLTEIADNVRGLTGSTENLSPLEISNKIKTTNEDLNATLDLILEYQNSLLDPEITNIKI